MSGDVAVHRWPAVPKAPNRTPSIKRPRSASSIARIAFFPPSSSPTLIIFLAALSYTRRPVSTPPVKETARMSGWATRPSPTPGPGPRDEFHDAGREARLVEDLDEPRRAEGREGRGLEDDRAARNQGRAALPSGNRHGEVPRRDEADRAHGEADGQAHLVRELRRDRRPEHPPPLAGRVLEEVDDLLDVPAALCEDLPHLPRHGPREVLLLAPEDPRGLDEELT